MESWVYRATTGSIPASRHAVSDWARRTGCPAATVRVIALLTTEAVTNAVVHGPDTGEVVVRATRADGVWRVSVTDQSPELPRVRRVGPEALGGRGVMLIDRLSAAWGVERVDGRSKAVWFEVTGEQGA